VQAGVSLHQAAHLIERGIAPMIAAAIVSAFSLTSGIAAFACGFLPRALPIRFPLALVSLFLTVSTLLMIVISRPRDGFVAGALFGLGIGGLLTLLPLAWADYFGRANFAAIRGIALSAQVLAQAAGPLLSGALHDWTGNNVRSLQCFIGLSAFGVFAALLARRPAVLATGGRSTIL
jgi:MFS transporter, OFA family, oxalate/formate antiporter